MRQKPILVLVDEDYEPSREDRTATEDVAESLDFHQIDGEVLEIDYIPAEAKSMCQRVIDNLIAMPHVTGQGETCVRVALDILCKLQKALEGVPVEPEKALLEEVHAFIGEALIDGCFPEDGEPGVAKRKDAEILHKKLFETLTKEEVEG